MKYSAVVIVSLICASSFALAQSAMPGPESGVVQGNVSFDGQAPEREKLVRDSDPVCASVEGFGEDVVVADGKLRDVLVRVVNAPAVGAKSAAPAVVRQSKCTYEPHVIGVLEGQSLSIENADPTFHNVRGTAGSKTLWNSAHPNAAPAIVRDAGSLGKAGDVVQLHCDVHPWMKAYVYVQASPYFAVSATDGSFRITGLPPGKYTLEATHPVLGKKTAKVTVSKPKKAPAAAKPATVSFRYVSK